MVTKSSGSMYQLVQNERCQDEEINKMISNAYQPKLGELVNTGVLSCVFAFLNPKDIESIASTNKFNSSKFQAINQIEKLSSRTYYCFDRYSAAMDAYNLALGSLSEELATPDLLKADSTIVTTGNAAGVGSGAGVGAGAGL